MRVTLNTRHTLFFSCYSRLCCNVYVMNYHAYDQHQWIGEVVMENLGRNAFPCARASKLNKQKSISPAPGRSSNLTHTGVEIDTCALQTGCQLSNLASGLSLGLCVLTQFQWHEAIVLDNWQLAGLPQSGGREFNPHRVHDNLSVPLWVYMRFRVPEHQH